MLQFNAIILKFESYAEKTGWTYIEIPAEIIRALNHWKKKSFRVKGFLDNYRIKEVALLMMRGGQFFMPINATMRKGTGKNEGDLLTVRIEKDRQFIMPDRDFMTCLDEDKAAKWNYICLPKSHQNYYNKWIGGAKTPQTKADRIACTIDALGKGQKFNEMLRAGREQR